ncbi:MAG: hypothetical protein WD269_02340 [Acidimicrobiia bacterium]
MRTLLVSVGLMVMAAAPQEVIPELEANGYYIEPGSGATESLISDAVFDGRADGGRLYIVVLAAEPPGGATTFADSVLDEMEEGYILTVAPESVGYAGDNSFWSADQMDRAVGASLDGSSDDDVVRLFIGELVPDPGGEGTAPTPTEAPGSTEGGGLGWIWLLLLVGGGLLVFWMMSRGSRQAPDLTSVRDLARAKLNQVANDIIELEDEVLLSEDIRVKEHYQRASQTYSTAMSTVEDANTAPALMTVSTSLDEAIWELDCAEALLDGKPLPPKPEPPKPAAPAETVAVPSEPQAPEYQRRSQRQSSFGSSELMNVLMAILASQGMRGGGGWGGYQGGGSTPGWPGSGGGPRSSGGGMRRPTGGMGRIRGGGRRRGG